MSVFQGRATDHYISSILAVKGHVRQLVCEKLSKTCHDFFHLFCSDFVSQITLAMYMQLDLKHFHFDIVSSRSNTAHMTAVSRVLPSPMMFVVPGINSQYQRHPIVVSSFGRYPDSTHLSSRIPNSSSSVRVRNSLYLPSG